MSAAGPAPPADARLEALADLRAALRDLLTRLEEPEVEQQVLLRGHERCDRCLARYRAASGELPAARGELAAELDASLEEALRLNAVVTSLAQRQIQRAAGALGNTRRLRRDLAAGPTRPATGGSCDISG